MTVPYSLTPYRQALLTEVTYVLLKFNVLSWDS